MSQKQHEDTLTVYSDFVCPFCYLGKAALEQYAEETENPPEVEWHVFDLRGYKRSPDGEIDHDVDDGKDDDYFAQVRENVERLKDEYDVEMTLDYSLDVDSWNAQKASIHLKENYDDETFETFHEAVFDALWQDGRDIGEPDVLAEIAETVDVSGEEVRDAIEDEALEEELESRFDAAQQRGVTGIPTFAFDGHAARGAVPPRQLQRLVEGT